MSIDGLSHAYRILKDDKLKALIDEMISVYSSIDKVSIKAANALYFNCRKGDDAHVLRNKRRKISDCGKKYI